MSAAGEAKGFEGRVDPVGGGGGSGGPGAEPLEVVVVGAGPHALAVVARLLDHAPDTSKNFAAGVIAKPIGTRASCKLLFEDARCSPAERERFRGRVRVVDAFGRWMAQWDKAFSALQIRQLRSSFEMHPCVFDSFALHAFVERHKLDGEMGTFDASRTKANDKVMFAAPSSDVFMRFCAHLVDRYGLNDMVEEDRVVSIDPDDADIFTVSLASGGVMRAKHVVVATGPMTVPRVPDWALGLVDCDEGDADAPPAGSIMHAWDLIGSNVAGGVPKSTDDAASWPTRIVEKASCTWSERLESQPRILIVGGGLTALHLFQRAVEHHKCRHVHLVSRSEFLVKQFDIDLSWVGYKTRPWRVKRFTQEKSADERVNMLRAARERGSVTPEAMKAVERSVKDCAREAELAGVGSEVSVEQGVSIEAAEWIHTDDARHGEGHFDVLFDDGSTRLYDLIWLATGSQFDVASDPLLGPLLEKKPIEVAGGFPVLESTLRWRKDCEVYVMGPFSALSVGPDALNLTGSRTGSFRIGNALRPLFHESERVDAD